VAERPPEGRAGPVETGRVLRVENIHAIPNLLSGFALSEEDAIFDYVRKATTPR